MAGQTNPFDQFDGPTNAGPRVLIPESGVVTEGRAVDLNNSRLTGQRTQQGIGLDAAAAARAAAAEDRQRTALAAQLYTQGLRIGANGQPEPIPGWKDPKKASAAQGVDPAAGLQRAINDMRKQFAAGPGATTGGAGLMDYLPTQPNKAFDKAASAARGYVGPALGLTASQLNSPGEIEAAIGPYIPTSRDYDENVRAAFDRLQGLAGDQRRRAGYTGPVEGVGPQQDQQQPAAMIPGAGAPPQTPQTPQGPAGYDVGSVDGAPSGGSGGGNFASAAGVAMAKRLSQEYTKGATVEKLNKLLSDNGFQQFTDPAALSAIKKRGRLNFAPPVADDTRGGVGRAVGDAIGSDGLFGDVAAYAANATDALTGNNLDSIVGGPTGLALDYANQRSPKASMLGTVVGGAAAAGGAELGLGALAARAGIGATPWLARGADALYGAVSGAGMADSPDQSRLAGAVVGGLGGLGGGMAGRSAVRGIGSALRGVRNADVQGLRAADVPLSVGQALSQSGGALGRGVQALENATTGIPGVGAVTRGRYTDSFEGLNRAAFDEGLAPINANTGGIVREQGVDLARGARSQAYSDALDPVQVQADAPFIGDMQGAIAAGRALPDPMSGNLDYTLPTRVGNSFDANGGLSGNDFQQSIRGLRRDARAVENLPYGHDFGQVTRQAEGALEGLLQRQAPDALPAYNAANTANRNVEILRDAVNRARSGTTTGDPGLFSAAQLSDASAANSRRFGGNQGTTNQPFYNLTRAAQRVLPSKVADSGTATRAAVTAGLGLSGAGGAGYAAGDSEGAAKGIGGTLALGGLLAAGGSRAGQRLLVSSLLDRPDMMIRAGNGIANRARIGGLFGAPMLASGGAYLAAPQ